MAEGLRRCPITVRIMARSPREQAVEAERTRAAYRLASAITNPPKATRSPPADGPQLSRPPLTSRGVAPRARDACTGLIASHAASRSHHRWPLLRSRPPPRWSRLRRLDAPAAPALAGAKLAWECPRCAHARGDRASGRHAAQYGPQAIHLAQPVPQLVPSRYGGGRQLRPVATNLLLARCYGRCYGFSLP